MFKAITRTSGFWAAFVAISIVSAVVGGKHLFKVLPMMSIDLRMDSKQALNKTQVLVKDYNWAPQNAWQAAHFQNDTLVQFFAELECGGIKTFQKMIEEKLYEPYQWHVRNFKEGVTQESHVYFTPQGHPYGFEIKLAEDDAPGNLSISEARKRALAVAQKDWNLSFDNYKEVETSKEETPKGRVDHTFLYERTDKTLGKDGKYRIKLVVRGNVFALLKQFVHVPEGFTRRYQEIRSQNNMFSSAFSMLFNILYLIIGGLIGGFILIRKRRYLLIPAAAAVGVLSFFSFFNILNSLPLMWMNYDTAMSSTSFISIIIISSMFGVLQNFIMFILIVGAGESLSRWAFPNHIQFWKSWSKEAGGSLTILGQTLGGYGLFCFELPLMATIYYALTHGLGWWAPTGTLIDPNILANYVPWLGAFSNSLSAGFWEEFAFRALPIAGIILLGRHFKKEKLFLIVGLIGQAIIFGGMHTFYAQQPVYFRIVELFIPSLIWAATYLVFGLLPGIICHYLWDLMWFAFPIMVSNAPGIIVQKIIVLTLALFPLLIVLFRRWQVGKWVYAPESAKNSAWKVPAESTTTVETQKTIVTTLSETKTKLILGAGAVGLAACLFFGTEKNSNPQLTLSKQQAIVAAQKNLTTLTNADTHWTVLAQPDTGTTPQQMRNYTYNHKFMWQTQSKEMYKNLLGTYLSTVHWKIRFSHFEGDITERAEEYICFVNTHEKVYRTLHVLPEAQEGKSLSEGQARNIALDTIKKQFELDTQQLKEISAIDSKKPHRKDWNFIFQDTTHELKEGGQTRINIAIGGDQVTDYEQFVFVPEAWTRQETQKDGVFGSFKLGCMLFLVLFILLTMGTVGGSSFEHFNFKQFLYFFGIICTLSGLGIANKLDMFTFNFITAQSYTSQLFSTFASLFGSVVLQSFGIAFLAGALVIYCKKATYKKHILLPLIGATIPVALCGIAALFSTFVPQLTPIVADLTPLSLQFPFVGPLVSSTVYLLLLASLFIPVSMYLSRITNHWKKNIVIGLLLCVSLGITAICMSGAESLIACLIIGIPVGLGLCLLHKCILTHDASLLIPATASLLALMLLKNGLLKGYPLAFTYAILGVLFISFVGYRWFKQIRVS
ncbi:MAG: hypothetical protein ACJAZS_000668 [Alteromonas naphthalenivorans]|jgi:hypothetical protein